MCTFGEAGAYWLISHLSGTLENITPDLCTCSETWEQIYWYAIEVEHWMTIVQTCAHPQRSRKTSIDSHWSEARGKYSGPMHASENTGAHQLVFHWSGTLEDVTLDICIYGYRNTVIYIQLKWSLENIALDLCTPMRIQEHINIYPTKVEHWQTLLQIYALLETKEHINT